VASICARSQRKWANVLARKYGVSALRQVSIPVVLFSMSHLQLNDNRRYVCTTREKAACYTGRLWVRRCQGSYGFSNLHLLVAEYDVPHIGAKEEPRGKYIGQQIVFLSFSCFIVIHAGCATNICGWVSFIVNVNAQQTCLWHFRQCLTSSVQ